ncbi:MULTISPECIES: ABC transporter substrate-binding protein [Microbacterium]|uniref:ABC transporter substrate-binding protein n=1 Tax=Microbacterium TaxID=33882 RepID=UPI0027802155|nr:MULTISPECIES: ABC transporter substrate-binding protein [Microbacterium]MDQ1082230.1 iron complex transport system substrate-binding protein [Microbacterium sp. SORGH_AS_0344]MDQ1168999.1 iron complex transport system substrate-binding protein [Microbacterium proteolyticum]
MSSPSRPALSTAALVASALVLAGCAAPAATAPQASAGGGYPVTVTDCGDDVQIAKRPERVLTVGTAAVELLDAAGASSAITARTAEFGAALPATLTDPPSGDLIIDPADPTTEAIVGATPDLVFGYGLFTADPVQVKAAGIPVLTVQGECGHDATTETGSVDLGTITADVRRLGTVFGTEATADAAADALDARVETASRPATGDSAAWVYYFSSEDPISAYGGTGMPEAVLTGAGLSNVYADQTDAYLTVSAESLLAAQPTWLVLTYGLYGESEQQAREKLLAEPGIADLDAVKAGRIVMVSADTSSPSPAAVAGLEQIVAGTNG